MLVIEPVVNRVAPRARGKLGGRRCLIGVRHLDYVNRAPRDRIGALLFNLDNLIKKEEE